MIYQTSKGLTSEGAGCRRVQASRFLRRYIRETAKEQIIMAIVEFKEVSRVEDHAAMVGHNPDLFSFWHIRIHLLKG